MSGNSPHQPPMCSIHQGDAWQSFLARILTTCQLRWRGREHF
uniref:Uncharacterized protein n=1 Tax=Anguilla anguilla TaxID=7936 RepID=A0A0E9R1J0_ANGAN